MDVFRNSAARLSHRNPAALADISPAFAALFSLNLGTLPPNTAVMIITDQFNKRQEVFLTADLSHNEVVYFIKIINPK